MTDILKTGVSSFASTASWTIPSSAAAGDYAVAFVVSVSGGTVTTPSGWTLIDSHAASGYTQNSYLFGRIVTPSGTGSPGSSVTISTSSYGHISTYSGVDTAGTPFTALTSEDEASGSAYTFTSFTTAVDGCLAILGVMQNQAGPFFPPAGYSELTDASGAGVASFDGYYPKAGASGSLLVEAGAAAVGAQIACYLRPASYTLPTIPYVNRWGPMSRAATSGAKTVTLPSGLASGDVVLAVCMGLSNAAWTTPTNWTSEADITVGTSHRMVVFSRVADGSWESGGTVSITAPAAVGNIITCLGIKANNTGTWEDVAATTQANSTASTTATSASGGITPVTNDALVLMLVSIAGTAHTTVTKDAGTTPVLTELMESGSFQGNDPNLAAFAGNLATAGSTGTRTAGLSQSRANGVILMAIRPAATGGADQDIGATAKASDLSIGSATVVPGEVTVTANAKVSDFSAGLAVVNFDQTFSANAKGSDFAAGQPTVNQELQFVAQGVNASGGIGQPSLEMVVVAQGLTATGGIGLAAVEQFITAVAVPSALAVGTAELLPGERVVVAQGVNVAGGQGQPTVTPGAADVVAQGHDASGAAGFALVTGGVPPVFGDSGRSRLRLGSGIG